MDRFAQRRRIKQYQERYLHRSEMFDALEAITEASDTAGISTMEAAIRWTQHHSVVDATLGDAILIGVSRLEQLQPIMEASKGGPLPRHVVEAAGRQRCCTLNENMLRLFPSRGRGSVRPPQRWRRLKLRFRSQRHRHRGEAPFGGPGGFARFLREALPAPRT